MLCESSANAVRTRLLYNLAAIDNIDAGGKVRQRAVGGDCHGHTLHIIDLISLLSLIGNALDSGQDTASEILPAVGIIIDIRAPGFT